MLAPISETIATELPLMRLGLESVDAYPEFVEELREASGMDPGYLRCGTLLAARDGDEAEALGRELELRESLGLAVHRLRSSEARRLEPALAPALRLALEIPDDHAIDPRKLTAALARAVTTAGGTLRTGATVERVSVADARVAGVAPHRRRADRRRARGRSRRRVDRGHRRPAASRYASRSTPSRARSFACTIPPARGCSRGCSA